MKDSYYRIVNNRLASVTLMPMPTLGMNVWAITEIAVQRPLRGKGMARVLVNEVLRDADSERARLVLQVAPSVGGSMDYRQLSCGISAWGSLGWMRPMGACRVIWSEHPIYFREDG